MRHLLSLGNDFLSNWNGLTAGDLFERIHNTMPLSKPGSLGRDVDADILAYIFAMNKFPSGQTDSQTIPQRSI